MSGGDSGPIENVAREAPRLDSDGIAWLWLEGQESYVTGYLSNLSDGGMFVTLTEPPPEGTELGFELSLMTTPAAIQGRGVVVWRRWSYEGPGRPPGVGIRFLHLEGEGKAQLATFFGGAASSGKGETEVVESPVELPHAQPPRTWSTPPAPAPQQVWPIELPERALLERGDDSSAAIPDRRRSWPELSSARSRRAARRPWLIVAAVVLVALGAVAIWLGVRERPVPIPGDQVVEQETSPIVPVSENPALPREEAGSASVGDLVPGAEDRATQETPALGGEAPVAVPTVEEPAPPTPAALATVAPVPPVSSPPSPVLAPFTRVSGVEIQSSGGGTRVAVLGDGAMANVAFTLSRMGGESPRAILQISGVSSPPDRSTFEAESAELLRVRTGLHPGGRLHLVLDLARANVDVAEPRVEGNRLVVELR